MIGCALAAATLLASVPASAQFAATNGTGDAAAQNQRSTVGIGDQTGSGGFGYRYGYGSNYAPYYSGRSAYVAPAYNYGNSYGYGNPYGYGSSVSPYDPD